MPNASPSKFTRAIMAQTHRLSPDYDPNEGLRARIKARWDKGKAPWARFKIDVSCPSVVTSGLPVTLTFSLAHDERSKELVDPPPVYLRRISAKLTSKLRVRIPSRALLGSSDMTDTHTDKQTLMDKLYYNAGQMLFDGATETTPIYPAHLVPAFQTFGLALEHTLKIELWGECAQEKFHITPFKEKLVIAKDIPGQSDEAPNPLPGYVKVAESSADAPPPEDDDTVPPPYQVLSKD